MKKILRSKAFWGALALIVAAALAFVALPLMNSQTRETVMVVRVNDRVPAQTQITEDMLNMVEVGAYGCPDDAFTSILSVAGLYTAVDLLPSDHLVPGKFASTLERQDESFYTLPESGKMIVSIPLSTLAASVSGKILPDDIVAVYAISKNPLTDAFEVVRYNDILYMRVAAVTNATATDTNEVDTDDSSASKADAIPATVSLYATDFQARRLIDIQATGTVYLALVGRGEAAMRLYEGFTPADPFAPITIAPEVNDTLMPPSMNGGEMK